MNILIGVVVFGFLVVLYQLNQIHIAQLANNAHQEKIVDLLENIQTNTDE
jgi:hypothetical protein